MNFSRSNYTSTAISTFIFLAGLVACEQKKGTDNDRVSTKDPNRGSEIGNTPKSQSYSVAADSENASAYSSYLKYFCTNGAFVAKPNPESYIFDSAWYVADDLPSIKCKFIPNNVSGEISSDDLWIEAYLRGENLNPIKRIEALEKHCVTDKKGLLTYSENKGYVCEFSKRRKDPGTSTRSLENPLEYPSEYAFYVNLCKAKGEGLILDGFEYSSSYFGFVDKPADENAKDQFICEFSETSTLREGTNTTPVVDKLDIMDALEKKRKENCDQHENLRTIWYNHISGDREYYIKRDKLKMNSILGPFNKSQPNSYDCKYEISYPLELFPLHSDWIEKYQP